jgi:CopG family nickel-responsive transcriptional regulator
MPDKSRTIRFSVSLPQDLLEELDERVIGRGYASRSEFVRDLIRDLLVEARWVDGTAEVFGVLAIIYDHHQRGLPARIMDVQHKRHVNVMCTTHIHLDHRNCLETVIIRGAPHEIEDAAVEIGGLRGVLYHALLRTSIVDSTSRTRKRPRHARKQS